MVSSLEGRKEVRSSTYFFFRRLITEPFRWANSYLLKRMNKFSACIFWKKYDANKCAPKNKYIYFSLCFDDVAVCFGVLPILLYLLLIILLSREKH